MSDKNHYPSMQPFNLQHARRNLTKNKNGLNSWWAAAPFHNNRTQKDGTK